MVCIAIINGKIVKDCDMDKYYISSNNVSEIIEKVNYRINNCQVATNAECTAE